MSEKPIRVGIRGAAGLLGSRLGAAIHRTKDMSLEVGVVLLDQTLASVLNRCKLLGGYRDTLPRRMFLNSPNGGENKAVCRLNESQDTIAFESASQLCWRATCDVIVDTAYPAGKETFAEQYRAFPGPIVLQDGASPEGRLIVPPLISPERNGQSNIYRMGDCILSGIIPILYPFRDSAKSIRVHMVTQFDGKEAYYLIIERATGMWIRADLRTKVEHELQELFPKQEVRVQAVVQIPSLLHYVATIEFELGMPMSHEDVHHLLRGVPRIQMLPMDVTSTYDINLARSFSNSIAPIMVFDSGILPMRGERSTTVLVTAAIYYRTAAVLPNIDAIRMLVHGVDPIVAMQQTDLDMEFATTP
ncbi:MAG: hypothetical protein HYV34_04530 [Candidatus Kerfeldbacteria bacterium]|nr:hypothetical protein [Candidatus Kerfeldbacteria bacterium]